MYSIHNRDDLQKLKKLNDINNKLKEQRLKKKLGRQDFHHNVNELFEPVTKKQTHIQESISNQTEKITENQEKSDASRQLITDAINQNTLSAQKSNKKFIQTINEAVKDYDTISKHSTQTINDLVKKNSISTDITHTLSNLFTNTNPQFNIHFIKEVNNYKFYINQYYKIPIKIEHQNIIFLITNHSYDLTDPNLEYFLNNPDLKRHQISNFVPIFNFLIDMNYDTKMGDKRSERYKLIKDLFDQYLIKSESTSASGLRSTKKDAKKDATKDVKKDAKKQIIKNDDSKIIILSSDPNELVNKLRILKQQRIAGNDSKLINTHIEAIVDQLLKLDIINTKEHSNILNL